MNNNNLYKLGALSCILSGGTIIIGKILGRIHFILAGEIFDFLSPLFGLFALTAIYLWKRNETAILGRIAYIILFTGIAMVLCLDFFGAFILPYLPEGMIEYLLEGPTGTVWAVSGIVFLSGIILFGITSMMAGIFPLAASLLFTIGFIPIPFGEIIPQGIVHAGSIMAGTGLIWWGIFLYQHTLFHKKVSDHEQQLKARSNHPRIVVALMTNAGLDDYLRISVRSCLKSPGAGGNTAKPRTPPKTTCPRGRRHFRKRPR
jgi:hypothetical protein